jgi:hypothetical protein
LTGVVVLAVVVDRAATKGADRQTLSGSLPACGTLQP